MANQLDQLLEQSEAGEQPSASDASTDQQTEANEQAEANERSPKQKPSLGSGQSALADEMTKASFSIKRELSLLSDEEIDEEISLGVLRAELRNSIRCSAEEMEYNTVQKKSLAARIERNNQALKAISENTYLDRVFKHQEQADERLDKALEARQEIAAYLLPYSGMA